MSARFCGKAAQLLIIGCGVLVAASASARPYVQLIKNGRQFKFSATNDANKSFIRKSFRVKSQSDIMRYQQRGKTGFKAQPRGYGGAGFGDGYFVVNVAKNGKGIGLTQVGLRPGATKASFSTALLKAPRGVRITKVGLGNAANGWIGVSWRGIKNGKEVNGHGKLSGKLPKGAKGMKLTRTKNVAPTYGGGWMNLK